MEGTLAEERVVIVVPIVCCLWAVVIFVTGELAQLTSIMLQHLTSIPHHPSQADCNEMRHDSREKTSMSKGFSRLIELQWKGSRSRLGK